MSVELYPTARDLEDKLSTLEDPILAERLLTSNPQLFTTPAEAPQPFESAAAEQEISMFALAWKRFGIMALAVTAAVSIVAGYVLTPMAVHRHAAALPATVRRPAIVQKARPPSHPAHAEATLRAAVRRDEAEIARLRARLAAKAAAPAPIHFVAPVRATAPAHHAAVHHVRPVHHAAVAHHPAGVSHALPAAAYPAAAPEQKPQIDNSTSAQREASTGSATSTSASTSASTTTSTSTSTSPSTNTNVGMPDGTKNPPPSTGRGGGGWDHVPAGIGGIILGRTVDPCTPQGGRIGTVLESIAGQLLTHGGRL